MTNSALGHALIGERSTRPRFLYVEPWRGQYRWSISSADGRIAEAVEGFSASREQATRDAKAYAKAQGWKVRDASY